VSSLRNKEWFTALQATGVPQLQAAKALMKA
jgi:hypothetical protein